MKRLELFFPVKPWNVNQAFGMCDPRVCDFYKSLGLKGHNGIDARAYHGEIVRAAHDGTVVFAAEDGSAGVGVVVRTDEQFLYNNGAAFFKSIYWHLQRDGVRVTVGQKVKTGDIIGLADNTGASTGDHLHFGLKPVYPGEKEWEWWNAEQENGFKGAIDPAPYFTGFAAVDAQTVYQKYNSVIAVLQKMLEALKSKG